MGGPFMQGIVLLGIIYWYSKGMLGLINEYYRSEFNQKLKRVPPEQKIHQSYDLDDMEQLIKMETLKDVGAAQVYDVDGKDSVVQQWNESHNFAFADNTDDKRCPRPSNRVEFLNILLQLLEHYPDIPDQQLYFNIKYPICLLDEKQQSSVIYRL